MRRGSWFEFGPLAFRNPHEPTIPTFSIKQTHKMQKIKPSFSLTGGTRDLVDLRMANPAQLPIGP
jgi:hypothetical protein